MASYTEESLPSWSQFLERLHQLRVEHEGLKAARPGVPPLLFRGHNDSSWQLATTLERYGKRSLSLLTYYRAISAARPEIEAYTGREWEIEGVPEYAAKARDSDAGFSLMTAPPAYAYMAYLRHHGFPSPLLDWTRSAHVAAYFAFKEASETRGHAAIFVYREHIGRGKGGSVGRPAIDVRGPYVRTHRRHFVQQCQYTVCSVFREGEWHYAAHEEVIAAGGNPEQDQFWKFILPLSERQRVLRYLDEYNLNAYSLFGSEVALMEMVAARALLDR